MGVRSNRIEKEALKAGDHIYSWRAAWVYAHHGIYAGEDKVIHFTRGRGQEVGTRTVIDLLLVSSSPARSTMPCLVCSSYQGTETNNGVMSSCLNCFLAGGDLYRFEYGVSKALFFAKVRGGTCTLAIADPDEEVVRRANYLLGNGFSRCYSLFKNNCEDFAIYCKTGLLVAEQGSTRIGQSGQAVTCDAAFRAAVASVLFGSEMMAFSLYCARRYRRDIGNRRDVLKVEVEDLKAGLASGRIRLVNIS